MDEEKVKDDIVDLGVVLMMLRRGGLDCMDGFGDEGRTRLMLWG